MLKNNYKTLFYLLMIPFYLIAAFAILALISGLAIEWKYIAIYLALNFLGAWLISFRKSLLLNIVGFLCFVYFGWPLFSYLFKHPEVGPWTINVGVGAIIIAFGFLGLVYAIIKRIKSPVKSEQTKFE